MITTALRRSIRYFEEYRERIRCGDLCHLYLNQTIGMEIFFNNVEHQTDFLYLYYKNIWFYVFILSFFSQNCVYASWVEFQDVSRMRDIVILDKKQILCICFHVMWIVWLIQQSPQIVHTFEATFVILAFTCMPSLWPQRWNSCLIQVKVMTNTCPTIVLINIFSFLFSYPINIVASICGWIILQSLHFCFSLTTTKKLLPVSSFYDGICWSILGRG